MNLKSIVVTIASTFLAFSQLAVAQNDGGDQNPNIKEFISLDSFPDWFEESMTREKKLKKKSKLKIKELEVDQKILGKVKLIEQSEGFWYYHIKIGTDTPVECYIFTEYDGPANSMYSIVDVSLNNVAAVYKKSLTGKYNYAIGNGVLNGTPYLLFDTFYSLGDDNEKISGILKAVSAETDDRLGLCIHNELGYRRTFLSVFESFISAIVKSEKNSDFFQSITQMSFNDIPVGYAIEKFSTDQDGDVQVINESSMLLPVDDSSVSRSDSQSISWSTPDGALINATEHSIENSVLSSSLSINYQDDKWQVTGQIQDKEVSYALEHNDWLLSSYGSYLATVNLKKSEQESVEFNLWASDVDPSQTTKMIINKVANDSNANLQFGMGPLTLKVMAEDNGALRHGVIEQGPVKINFKTIFSKGDPTL